MNRILSMAIVLAILGWMICLNTARARCVGGSLGDACIGIPTPSPAAPVYVEPQPPAVVVAPRPPIVVEHHHHHVHPDIVIEHHRDDPDED
jgi:hypothetical protein